MQPYFAGHPLPDSIVQMDADPTYKGSWHCRSAADAHVLMMELAVMAYRYSTALKFWTGPSQIEGSTEPSWSVMAQAGTTYWTEL